MKTIRYIIAILFLWPVCATMAQDNTNTKPQTIKGYLAFSGGLSLPQNEFPASSPSIPGGYALPGGTFNVSFALTPAHFPIGFAAMGGYYFNRYDFGSYLGRVQAADAGSKYATNDPNAMNIYYVGFFGMAGLCKEVALSKVAFDFRILAGSIGLSTPEMNYYAVHPGSSLFAPSTETSWDISSARSSALCYDLGVTARVKRFNNANVFVNVDYIHSAIPYSTTIIYTDQDGNMSSSVNNTTISLSFISFSIGLGYDIGE